MGMSNSRIGSPNSHAADFPTLALSASDHLFCMACACAWVVFGQSSSAGAGLYLESLKPFEHCAFLASPSGVR